MRTQGVQRTPGVRKQGVSLVLVLPQGQQMRGGKLAPGQPRAGKPRTQSERAGRGHRQLLPQGGQLKRVAQRQPTLAVRRLAVRIPVALKLDATQCPAVTTADAIPQANPLPSHQ